MAVSVRALNQRVTAAGGRTWRGIVAVWRRDVGVVPRGALPVALGLGGLRGEAGVVLAALLCAAGIGRRGRQIHRRVSPGCSALLLLQELLRVPVLVVWPRHVVVLGLVRVCVLHGDVAVAVIVARAAGGGGAGGRLDGH